MTVLLVGADHTSMPLDAFERFAVTGERLDKLCDDLAGAEHISEFVVVGTCNRTEVYAVAETFHGAQTELTEAFERISGLGVEDFDEHLVIRYGEDAVRHLFQVTAGLRSAVVGEHEILGQVREAWEAARTRGSAGSTMNLLFRHAVEVGKRARTETSIGRHTASVSQAAVELAGERLGTLAGRHLVVLGAGSMARGVVASATRAGARVTVVNRTVGRAQELAAEVAPDAGVVALDELADAIAVADVVITAAAGGRILVRPEHLGGSRCLLVDVAIPRNVDPAVRFCPEAVLADMADVRTRTELGLARRRAEMVAVGAIVDEELLRFRTARSGQEAGPLIGALRDHFAQVRESELERFGSRLDRMSEADRELVTKLVRSIEAKVLHQPSMKLRESAGSLRGQRLFEASRELFDL